MLESILSVAGKIKNFFSTNTTNVDKEETPNDKEKALKDKLDKARFKFVVDHPTYQQNLRVHIQKWLRRKARAVSDDYLTAAFILYNLNLDPIRPMLQPLYAKNSRGRKPIDPILVFRSFLLMTILQYESITKFANDLRHNHRLAIIAGSKYKQTPSIGAFYLLVDRLEDGGFQSPCPHIVKLSSLRKHGVIHNFKVEKQQKKVDKKKFLSNAIP
jgi:hypothetical protein